jgi:ribonuclease Y
VQIGIGIAIGVAAGVALTLLAVSMFGTTGVRKARRIREQLLDDARRESDVVRREAQVEAEAVRREAQVEAEAVRRETQIEAREQAVRLRSEIDAEVTDRRAQVLQIEERVLAKEGELEQKLVELARREQGLADRETHLRQLQEELKQAKTAQLAALERAAGMSQADARAYLLERGEEQVRHELARRVRMLEDEARAESRRRARNLVADALQRVAATHTAETTVTVVELPSDDMKGRIIGREGRNIRALEHLTGVDFIVDDTPHAVVLSSFDGLRREIARLTVTKLIEDGRIHPARIEETYYESKAEVDEVVRQAGEQAVFEAHCGAFHEDLVQTLGRLRYRTSYGQNVLKHTLEVVHLAGIMATELGASVQTAKRAAMLHDIGKAMTHEVEGSHALISAQLARRYGESQGVVHAIEAHHYEVQPQTVEAVLLIAADAVSASRPGARGESLEHYIKRLEALEELAAAKRGVEKVYALQAGREIRVIVSPGEVDDDEAALLAHEIAREIEDRLEYPGQVKVTVIRESRAVEVARNHGPGQAPPGDSEPADSPIQAA